MRSAEWLDKIIHDELFACDSGETDTNVGGKTKAAWEERMLHTFLAEGERRV
jgi:hypothetical protein